MTIRFALAAAFLIVFAILGAARYETSAAQAAQQGQSTAAQQPQFNMPDMMKMHEQMMAQMKADDAKLDALVKDMNAASGNKKVDAIAAVVTELVRQHEATYGRMGQMHEQMMGMGGMMMGMRGMMRGR